VEPSLFFGVPKNALEVVAEPLVDRLSQRAGIERMDPGPARPFDTDKSGFLQHVEMLRDRLTRKRRPVLRGRTGTDFEQRLLRTLAQAIYDPATGRVAKRLEEAIEFIVIHAIEYAIKSLHVKTPSIVAAPTR
jgi:hypothetical protein